MQNKGVRPSLSARQARKLEKSLACGLYFINEVLRINEKQ